MSLLVVVIILASALLIMGVGAALIGLSNREAGYAVEQSREAQALADGCMNEAYGRIRKNQNFGIGQGSLPFTAPNGSCTIQVIDTGSDTRQIDVTSSIRNFTHHIRSTVIISGGSLQITSWEERND